MEEQIQENPQPTQPVQPEPVEPKKKSKLPLIVILLVVILLIAAGAVYTGMQLKEKQLVEKSFPEVIPTTVVEPSLVPTLVPVVDETSNWKTYTDTLYGFSFKYPDNLVYEISNFDSTLTMSVMEKDKLRFQIKGMKSYPAGQKDYLLDTSSNGQKTVDNRIWKTYSLPNGYSDMAGSSPPIYGLQAENRNTLYSIYFYGQSSENEFSNQILSTFKFLD